jgi:hypothetical protein
VVHEEKRALPVAKAARIFLIPNPGRFVFLSFYIEAFDSGES